MSDLRADPAFALHVGPGLRLRGPVRGSEVARLLARRIRRNHQDLHAHVLRIQLLIAARSQRRLCGALIDLHIALASGGAALRARLLEAARSNLSKRQLRLFDKHSEQVMPAHVLLSDLRGSVLAEGYEGAAELIVQEQTVEGFASPLEEALSCLEYGQLDEARTVLENALLDNPDDAEVCAELVNLYTHSNDELAVIDLCSRFIEHGEIPPDAIANLLGVD